MPFYALAGALCGNGLGIGLEKILDRATVAVLAIVAIVAFLVFPASPVRSIRWWVCLSNIYLSIYLSIYVSALTIKIIYAVRNDQV